MMKVFLVMITCLGALIGPSVAYANDEPADPALIDDLRFGLVFTSTVINEDGGFSAVAEYNLFAYAWFGAQLAWNQMGTELSEVWPAGTLRWVAPGSAVGDFQAFAAVGGAGRGVNFRIEAGPIWKFGVSDVSLTVGFLHVNSAVEQDTKDLTGFCLTFGAFWPGH